LKAKVLREWKSLSLEDNVRPGTKSEIGSSTVSKAQPVDPTQVTEQRQCKEDHFKSEKVMFFPKIQIDKPFHTVCVIEKCLMVKESNDPVCHIQR